MANAPCRKEKSHREARFLRLAYVLLSRLRPATIDEARTVRLPIFLLARDWRKAGGTAKASPRLIRECVQLLDTAIITSETQPLRPCERGRIAGWPQERSIAHGV